MSGLCEWPSGYCHHLLCERVWFDPRSRRVESVFHLFGVRKTSSGVTAVEYYVLIELQFFPRGGSSRVASKTDSIYIFRPGAFNAAKAPVRTQITITVTFTIAVSSKYHWNLFRVNMRKKFFFSCASNNCRFLCTVETSHCHIVCCHIIIESSCLFFCVIQLLPLADFWRY